MGKGAQGGGRADIGGNDTAEDSRTPRGSGFRLKHWGSRGLQRSFLDSEVESESVSHQSTN